MTKGKRGRKKQQQIAFCFWLKDIDDELIKTTTFNSASFQQISGPLKNVVSAYSEWRTKGRLDVGMAGGCFQLKIKILWIIYYFYKIRLGKP